MATPYVPPQFQGDILDVQRKQALADALMGMSMRNQGDQMNQVGAGMRVMPRMSPLQGVAQMAQALLAGKLGSDAIQGQRDLGLRQAAWWNQQMGGGTPQQAEQAQPPQPDVIPQDAPQAPLSFGIGAGGGFTQGGPDAHTTMLANALQQSQAPQATPQPAQPSTSPMNPLGLPSGLAAMYAQQDMPGYMKDFVAPAYKPAEIVAQLRAAGIDPNSQLGRQMAQQSLAKANYISPVSLRPGGYMFDPMSGKTQQMPHVPDGFTAVPGPDGQWQIVPVAGGIPAMQAASQAQAAGKAAVTPITGYQNGQPVFTNALNASQGGAAGPGAGGAPVNTGRFGGYTPAGGAGPVTPGLAPGVATAAEGMATQNTKRSGALVDAATDSPTRVNVLDNILGLSQSGVGTGPTAEWKNKVKGALADTIGPDSWKDDVTGFQEMKKFLKQNGLRAWQAAGGSGTDSQLSAAMEANPNDKMFPQAVQTMAKWAKAGELALQSKASAQDAWLARNGNNPAAQNQFEAAWRTNFDPRIYQMKMMAPAELQAFTAKLSPAERATLLQKYSTAKQNGWIQ